MSYDDDFEDDQLGVCDTCLDEVPESDLDDGECPTCQEAAAADAGDDRCSNPSCGRPQIEHVYIAAEHRAAWICPGAVFRAPGSPPAEGGEG
jgi:hypothetical protein